MTKYEFRIYLPNKDDLQAPHEVVVRVEECSSESAALTKAGNYAKYHNAPVDLALAGRTEWNKRYRTTAFPASDRVKGFRHEKLA